MFMVVGLVRQAASCLFTILRHTAGYLFREVLVTPSLIICSVRACDSYLFSSGLVTYGRLFVQKTPSGTQVIICSENTQ